MSRNGCTDRPEWLRVRACTGGRVEEVTSVLERRALRTVCRDARCPNVGECWGAGSATILILGGSCTRRCTFCSVEKGVPAPLDPGEPDRIAVAAAELGWRHVVVTSVTRDDLPDGGAAQFARVVYAIRKAAPSTTVELLVPDFGSDAEALQTVLECRPEVLAHNVETVPRLYPFVRPQADYRNSLELLQRASLIKPGIILKSGFMVGFGERDAEITSVMEDLFASGCRSITIGQYLPPTRNHPPVARYFTREDFEQFAEDARGIGFSRVASGPLVRSSYKAEA